MAKRLTGINPLAYIGVEPSMPSNTLSEPRDPTDNDLRGFNLGDLWINSTTRSLWILASKSQLVSPKWIKLSSESADLGTLTGDSGGAVTPSGGNINVQGNPGSPYLTVGNASPNTLFIDDDGTVPTIFDTDGDAINPAFNTIVIAGGDLITTSGAGDTVTIDLDNGTDGQLIIGATGGSPAYANLTSSGGTIAITNGANTINLEAVGAGGGIGQLDGDTGSATGATVTIAGGNNITTAAAGSTVTVNVDGATEHAVQIGAADGSLADLGPLTTGQLIIGVTGSAPNLATLTAGANITIDDTTTPGEIEISSAGGGSAGVIITTFTTSGFFAKDPNTKAISIYLWNGGTGGGGAGTSAPTESGAPPGGAAWYYMIPAAFFGPSETVTVGSGGAGGAGGATRSVGMLGTQSWVGNITAILPDPPSLGLVRQGPAMFSLGTPDSVYASPQSGPGAVGGGQEGRDIGSQTSSGGSSKSGRYPSGTAGGRGAPNDSSPNGQDGASVYALDNTTLIYAGGAGGVNSNGSNGVNGLTSAAGGIIAPGTGGGGGSWSAGTGFDGGMGGYNSGGGSGGVGAASGGSGGMGGQGYIIIIEHL